jgi:LysR family transcriptional regulator, cyn operon transcriptional activator
VILSIDLAFWATEDWFGHLSGMFRSYCVASNANVCCHSMQSLHYTLMHLQHLRAFTAIVDAGTFANASARLHLSQPALSRQIDALERELGVSLFERVGRRVRLTPEGEHLLANCRQVLTDVSALGEQARALHSGESGLLRVGAPPQAIEYLLAQFLATFRQRYPRVDVHLTEAGAGAKLRNLLSAGEVQIALLAGGDHHFRFQKLYPTCSLAVVPEGHRLCRRSLVEVDEFTDEAMLLLSQDFAVREWFDAVCKLNGIHPRVLLESSAPHTMVAMARAGHGIAVVPSTMSVGDGVRALPIVHRGEPVGGWLVAAWDGGRYFAPYAEAFIKALSESVRKNYPGRELLRRLPSLPPIGLQDD